MILYSKIVQEQEHNQDYNRLIIKPIIVDTMSYLVNKGTTDFTPWYNNAIEIMHHKLLGDRVKYNGKLTPAVSMNLADLKTMIETGFITCENKFDFIAISKQCTAYIDAYIAQRNKRLDLYLENPITIDNLDDLQRTINDY